MFSSSQHSLFSEKCLRPTDREQDKLNFCISLIEDVLEDEEDGPLIVKLQFIAEQIRLLRRRPYQRRYSPKFLATCVLWENTSPNLYRQMAEEDLITLPSHK
jgi:hypothetical protein